MATSALAARAYGRARARVGESDDEGACKSGREREGGEAEKGSAAMKRRSSGALATGISRCGKYPHAGARQGPRRWGRRVGRILGHLGSARAIDSVGRRVGRILSHLGSTRAIDDVGRRVGMRDLGA
jgi:hypothetical protein